MGHPLSTRAGFEATKAYARRQLYAHIDGLGTKLRKGLQNAVESTHANAYVTGLGSMSKIHFLSGRVNSYDLRSLKAHADHDMENRYFHHLLSNRILTMTDRQVHFYVSIAHSEEEIEKLINTTEDFLRSI